MPDDVDGLERALGRDRRYLDRLALALDAAALSDLALTLAERLADHHDALMRDTDTDQEDLCP